MPTIKMRDAKPGDVIRVQEIGRTKDGAIVLKIEPAEGLNPELEYMLVTLEVRKEVGWKNKRRIETDAFIATYPGDGEVDLFE